MSPDDSREPPPAQDPAGSPASLDALRERAAGRILDDERLRGPLEDATFTPLQSLALVWVDACVRASAKLDDEAARAAVDACVDRARSRLEALVALLADWELSAPSSRRQRLGDLAPTFPAPALASQAATLASLAGAAEAAERIVALLPPAPA